MENEINRFDSDELPVLASCREVASRSSLVFLHPEKIGPAVSKWGRMLGAAPSWDHPSHFFDGTEETVRWIFTLDILNHCFWPDPGKPAWTVRCGGEYWSGYWGLAAALKRAMEAGFAVADPAWLANIGARDLKLIFSYRPPATGGRTEEHFPDSTSGKGVESPAGAFSTPGYHASSRETFPEIPLFHERLYNLREAGSVILSDLGGDIMTLLNDARGSAVRLVKSVVRHFPSFRDEAVHDGVPVFFWKRAQIFAADVYAAFGGRGLGNFHDIEALTAFADYKVPQVLREMGIISYRPDLAGQVDALKYLESGSAPEVEIRAMTVAAVDEIRKAVEGAVTGGTAAAGNLRGAVTSSQIDSWLWNLGQMDEFRKHPYHRCRTIYY